MFAKKSIPRLFSVLFVIVFMLAVTPLQGAHAAGVRYAKPAASGTGDCSSWANACTLQTALTGAVSGDEIWAAAGTHKPTTGTYRTATFQLKNGVALYGGFAGTETARDQRNPAVNVTILSGDLNGDDVGFTNNYDNAYHVVTGATGATLDGFTITAGAANSFDIPNNRGGGMYNSSGNNPTLTNVSFSGNDAFWGGGMYNDSSSPTLTNVTFSGNRATYGGGVYNASSSPILTNVTFIGNWAGSGGGMYNSSSSPTLTNVTFSGNSGDGGGMYNSSSSPTLTNVTFSGNRATYGGGMYNTSGSNPTLVNSILWGNSPNEIYNDGSVPIITYSDVYTPTGVYSGTGNINADPLFIVPITATAAPTTTGNYRLYACSFAIDAGNSSAITVPTDLDGNPRVMGAAVDMGAYETAPASIACLMLTKSVAPLVATPGDPITYTLTFRNKGPVNTLTATAVIITDIVPVSVTNTSVLSSGAVITQVTGARYVWQVQDLAPGQGGVITIAGYLSPAPPVPLNILNTAVITTGVGDGYPADNTSAATVHIPGVIYVDQDAPGPAHNGLSWTTAYTDVQQALTAAISGDEIWVAAGTYKPTTNPTSRKDATFQLKSGVALYGGFAGTETARDQRNPAVNVTILSGDIDNNDSQTPIITDPATVTGNTTNSCQVVTGATGATLDGFTITAGYANQWAHDSGGGMYNTSGSNPTLTNVTFSGNWAYYGGGMYNSSSSPALTNVTFSGNTASSGGGGMYNSSGSNPTLTNVTFNGNGATDINNGGGMYNTSSSPALTNVTFSRNSAGGDGGGMYNTSGSNPTLTNITFSGNRADYGGGMYNTSGSNPTLTNVTFSSNSAWSGGGMDNDSSSPTLTNVTFSGNSALFGGGGMDNLSSTLTIRNTIFWSNTASGAGSQIYNNGGSSVVSDSVVQGGCPAGSTCTNIITADPRLGPLGDYGYGGSTQTIPLLPGSSAIDTGNDAICPATDQRGVARPQGAHCDIGAYEYDYIIFSIYHVKPVASGMGTCSSWANACPLQSALGLTISGDEIWAAAGTYKPTTDPTNRNASFQLKDGVAIYGGFAGTETTRDQRNPATNVTILSGDIDNNDSQKPIITDLATVTGNTTNSYHVVTGTTTMTGATLDGFTITAGYAISIYANDPDSGSGMYNTSGSNLTLTNVTFSGNSAKYGGGMYNSSSSPTLTNVTFSGNWADSSGGGMYNTSGSNPTLTNVTFSNNSAWFGGGMSNGSSNPTLTNVTFSNNSAYHGGGAINWNGGGMYNSSGSPALTNVTFSGNSAYNGGGMYNSSGSPALTNVTFNGNTATQTGGGMYNTSGSNPTLANVTFSGNRAGLGGGGMINLSRSSPTLTNVTFSENSTGIAGGGMYNENSSNPMLTNVTFNGNTASIGGGMYNNITSNPTLTNVTFSGNSADGNGGGMYNVNSSPTLTNVTFSGNSASQKGGGMYNTSGSPTIRNTIFWSNTASSAGAQIFNNGSSSVVSDSVVLAGCPAGSTCTNIIITDPKLGPLGNYGGSNQTIPLLPGSSAIDTGNDAFCPATDQRGVARPQGAHCDIGAYEYYEVDTTAPVVNSITRLNPSPTNLASVGFTVTFSESVTGVDVSDFVLTTAGISGASVTGVSGLGSVYTVTVDTGSGTGTLRLDVTDDDSIVDMAGNPLGGTGTGNGNFTSGETYDVRFHLIYLPLVLRNWP